MRRIVSVFVSVLILVFLCSCIQDKELSDVQELFVGTDEIIEVDNSKAKVVVLSGQSNAAGRSKISELSEDDSVKYSEGLSDIMMISENGRTGNSTETFVCVSTGWGDESSMFGPEVGIAEYLSEVYPGETIYIIKYGYSGAPIGEFLPGKTCFNALCETMDTGIETLESKGLDPEIVAFCWIQGETDASYDDMTSNYAGNEQLLFTSLRQKYGDFLILDAGISDTWPNYCEVNHIKRDNCFLLDRCIFINSNKNGVKVSNSDTAHYDAYSMILLGNLFAQQITAHISCAF